ncbi:putative membrane protein [Humitalea rosea]|uniref:Putative membrane protein n=1 Tax=Humitalea rosea TaxID=990373 RepID=A0A2W7IY89_9PROT|nr:DUF697 domain-containing protein [Humitalea rosea]PZW51165.1 putative membrane protein [Humitalea rosea]
MSGFRPGFSDEPPPPQREPVLEPGFVETTTPAPAAPDWSPASTAPPATGVGALGWIAGGLCLLLGGSLVMSMIGFAMDQMARSPTLGFVTLGVQAAAVLALGAGAGMELRAWRRLRLVDGLRLALTDPAMPLETARAAAIDWLDLLGARLPEVAITRQALLDCTSIAELRAMLDHRAIAPLQEQSRRAGERAGLQGAALVAIAPSPALDGLVAGVRGLVLLREVAAIHGLRPGLSVTIGLLRRVAHTALGVAAVDVAAASAADYALGAMPGVKHIAAAVPGAGLTARRLYRLALAVAEACSPRGDFTR